MSPVGRSGSLRRWHFSAVSVTAIAELKQAIRLNPDDARVHINLGGFLPLGESRLWPRCLDTMVLVKPATVVQWHRQGFRLFWRWRSRSGRPSVDREVRDLIRQMSIANPLWGVVVEVAHRKTSHQPDSAWARKGKLSSIR
jgi:hypothetical protein